MTNKNCTKCKENKEIDEFYEYTHQNGRKYRKSICKLCFSKSSKPYIEKWLKKEGTRDKINTKRRLTSSTTIAKEKKAKQARKYLVNNIAYTIYSRTRLRAKKLDLPFNLDKEDIIIPEYCPILEIPIFVGVKKDYKNSPSLDRIDPLKGYTKGNIRVISMLANTMKNSANFELLEKFSKNIINYINNNDIVRPIENKKSIESKDKEL